MRVNIEVTYGCNANDLVASKTVLIESESGAGPERALKQALGEVKLKRFGIVKGQETGANLLWREPGTRPQTPRIASPS